MKTSEIDFYAHQGYVALDSAQPKPDRAGLTPHEALALEDYEAREGRVVLVSTVRSLRDYDNVDFQFDPPIPVRVLRTSSADIVRGDGGFVDPYWDVEFLGAPPPETKGCTWFWIDGPSYGIETGHVSGDVMDAPSEIGGIA